MYKLYNLSLRQYYLKFYSGVERPLKNKRLWVTKEEFEVHKNENQNVGYHRKWNNPSEKNKKKIRTIFTIRFVARWKSLRHIYEF